VDALQSTITSEAQREASQYTNALVLGIQQLAAAISLPAPGGMASINGMVAAQEAAGTAVSAPTPLSWLVEHLCKAERRRLAGTEQPETTASDDRSTARGSGFPVRNFSTCRRWAMTGVVDVTCTSFSMLSALSGS
jgi:hypothetical protein